MSPAYGASFTWSPTCTDAVPLSVAVAEASSTSVTFAVADLVDDDAKDLLRLRIQNCPARPADFDGVAHLHAVAFADVDDQRVAADVGHQARVADSRGRRQFRAELVQRHCHLLGRTVHRLAEHRFLKRPRGHVDVPCGVAAGGD